jgi:hypothetical protein
MPNIFKRSASGGHTALAKLLDQVRDVIRQIARGAGTAVRLKWTAFALLQSLNSIWLEFALNSWLAGFLRKLAGLLLRPEFGQWD